MNRQRRRPPERRRRADHNFAVASIAVLTLWRRTGSCANRAPQRRRRTLAIVGAPPWCCRGDRRPLARACARRPITVWREVVSAPTTANCVSPVSRPLWLGTVQRSEQVSLGRY
jgi:hypothetical protein